MSLTLIAAGSSVPDAIASLIVVREGNLTTALLSFTFMPCITQIHKYARGKQTCITQNHICYALSKQTCITQIHKDSSHISLKFTTMADKCLLHRSVRNARHNFTQLRAVEQQYHEYALWQHHVLYWL